MGSGEVQIHDENEAKTISAEIALVEHSAIANLSHMSNQDPQGTWQITERDRQRSNRVPPLSIPNSLSKVLPLV